MGEKMIVPPENEIETLLYFLYATRRNIAYSEQRRNEHRKRAESGNAISAKIAVFTESQLAPMYARRDSLMAMLTRYGIDIEARIEQLTERFIAEEIGGAQ